MVIFLISSNQPLDAATLLAPRPMGALAPLTDPPLGAAAIPPYIPLDNFTQRFDWMHRFFTAPAPLFVMPDVSNALFYQASFLDYFNTSIFEQRNLPVTLPNIIQSQRFLQVLREAYQSIYNFCHNPLPGQVQVEYLVEMFKKTLENLDIIYGLAKLESELGQGQAATGPAALNFIPQAPAPSLNLFRHTIGHLLGRIFVVERDLAVSRIISQATGILKHRIVVGRALANEVITCCHCIPPSKNNLPIEVYFIRAENLDLNTGLPTSATINNSLGLPAANDPTESDFIRYLQQESVTFTNNNVRRIEKFKVQNHDISDLEHHSPQYTLQEDCGYGTLNENFVLPGGGDEFATIHVCHVGDPLFGAGAAFNYYALGFPTFPYYGVAGYGALLTRFRVAPLIITQGDTMLMDPAGRRWFDIVNGGTFQHKAPIARGMSGGIVFSIDIAASTINILGINRGTTSFAELSYACIL